MKKLQNGIFNLFTIIAYMAQLNLQWVLFTVLGGGILGIGPTTAVTLRYLHEFREEKHDHSLKDFWRDYKRSFKSFAPLGAGFLLLVALMLLNVRIAAVFFKDLTWVSPVYTFVALVVIYVAFMCFCTFAKAEGTSLKECAKTSFFMSFRYPAQGLALILSWYLALLLLGAKSSLLLLFGMSLLLFFAEFFHSQMIAKTRALQIKRGIIHETIDVDQKI